MRRTAVVLNIILLLFVAYGLTTDGFPTEAKGILFVLLLIVAPLFSVVALFRGTGESWLSLYLRRKALEEKKKIESLTTERKR